MATASTIAVIRVSGAFQAGQKRHRGDCNSHGDYRKKRHAMIGGDNDSDR